MTIEWRNQKEEELYKPLLEKEIKYDDNKKC